MRVNGVDYALLDDGTLDTVIGAWCGDEMKELRYDLEFASNWRYHDGCLNFERFVLDVVADDAEEEFAECVQ